MLMDAGYVILLLALVLVVRVLIVVWWNCRGPPMREGFREIVQGWALITGVDDITERIERAAEWTKANRPLQPDEEAMIKLMIECQIAREMFPE
jgi:hypothetical protein